MSGFGGSWSITAIMVPVSLKNLNMNTKAMVSRSLAWPIDPCKLKSSSRKKLGTHFLLQMWACSKGRSHLDHCLLIGWTYIYPIRAQLLYMNLCTETVASIYDLRILSHSFSQSPLLKLVITLREKYFPVMLRTVKVIPWLYCIIWSCW